MSQITDQAYLRGEQYKDASNLNARICVHQRFSTNDYPWQRWVFDRLDLPRRCQVLDVGCGPGDLWTKNADRLPSGWTIVLSDVSLGMLQQAQHNLSSRPQPFRYQVVDAQDIPFQDASFDAVLANHMLYHVPDRDRALHEFSRVLRPGGHLYAATNGHRHLQELRKLVARFCGDADTGNVALEFGLENGSAQLFEHFDYVVCHRQENALVVTQAEPLIAYIRSMMGDTPWSGGMEAISRWVRRQISAEGAMHIQKDSGLFKATKA